MLYTKCPLRERVMRGLGYIIYLPREANDKVSISPLGAGEQIHLGGNATAEVNNTHGVIHVLGGVYCKRMDYQLLCKASW